MKKIFLPVKIYNIKQQFTEQFYNDLNPKDDFFKDIIINQICKMLREELDISTLAKTYIKEFGFLSYFYQIGIVDINTIKKFKKKYDKDENVYFLEVDFNCFTLKNKKIVKEYFNIEDADINIFDLMKKCFNEIVKIQKNKKIVKEYFKK